MINIPPGNESANSVSDARPAEDYGPELVPQHQELLRASSISVEVARARGYRSATSKAELKALGFSEKQLRVPALLIPVWGVAGEIVLYQTRPDQPRIDKRGKVVKYETPAESKMAIDVPPMVRQFLGDPSLPLYITEGVRKADAAVSKGLCCIALLGVWNYRGTNDLGGSTALADWEYIHLKGRDVYVVFDSDVMTKREVHQALARLKAFLESRGANVHLIYLPAGEGGKKQGLDDFFAAGHTVADLLVLATDTLRQPPCDPAEVDTPYIETGSGIVWKRPTQNGITPVPLTNFKAHIVSDIILDNGGETLRKFGIEAELGNRRAAFEVPASQFAPMNWVHDNLGAHAIVSPGFGLKDHARAAVQYLSPKSFERRIYVHTGWRQVNGVWVYLNSSGALGANFPVAVTLEKALERYVLPSQVDKTAARESILRSLKLLSLAPKRVTIPILASVYLAPLTSFLNPDFMIWLFGKTGSLKSSILSVFLCHFGPSFSRTSLPADWHSTANFLEKMAFLAKDLPFLIDDFAPAKNAHEASEMERKASFLIRAIGNRSGRGRMKSDTSLRAAYIPRCTLWSTGEQLPSGQSEMARVLGLELRRQDVDMSLLTEAQEHAHSLAIGMSYYILALRESLDDVSQLQARWQEYRAKLLGNAIHLRTPEIAAHLMLGFDLFLGVTLDLKVISDSQCQELRAEAFTAIPEAVREQDSRIGGEDPVVRFAEILIELESQGAVSLSGHARDFRTEMIGWQEAATGHLLMLSEASYRRIAQFCQQAGGYFSLKSGALHKALHDAGVLIPSSDGRLVDRAYEPKDGKQIRVLRLVESKFRALAGSGHHDKTDKTYETTSVEEES